MLRPSHFGRPDIDEMIEKAVAVFDPEEREKLYIEATKAAMAQQPLLPLHFQVNIFAMKQGFSLRPRMQEGVRAWEVDPKS